MESVIIAIPYWLCWVFLALWGLSILARFLDVVTRSRETRLDEAELRERFK